MATVFVSYKSETETQSLAFVEQLENEGIDCWIACRDIPLGADYIDEIPGAIDDCPCFLLLLSENVAASPWIKLELKQAISDGKQILPIMMEDFKLPRSYVFMLQNYQIYSVFDGNREAFQQVVSRVHKLFPRLKPPAKQAPAPQQTPVTPSTPAEKPAPVAKPASDIFSVSPYPHVPYNGDKPYIYVCYAHKDVNRVLPIIHLLQDRGFRVWWDTGLEPGAYWSELIEEKLRGSSCVIAFFSEAFHTSKACLNEVSYALFSHTDFLSVYLEECTLPPGFHMQLLNQQALFRYRHENDESFVDVLSKMPVLAPCDSSLFHE